MTVPRYVQDLLSRSTYVYSTSPLMTENPNYAAGYTIRIEKNSEYAEAATLRNEVERLVRWANRVAGIETAHILSVPARTHHYKQGAVVTIFDPVMQKIEQYIPTNRKEKSP